MVAPTTAAFRHFNPSFSSRVQIRLEFKFDSGLRKKRGGGGAIFAPPSRSVSDIDADDDFETVYHDLAYCIRPADLIENEHIFICELDIRSTPRSQTQSSKWSVDIEECMAPQCRPRLDRYRCTWLRCSETLAAPQRQRIFPHYSSRAHSLTGSSLIMRKKIPRGRLSSARSPARGKHGHCSARSLHRKAVSFVVPSTNDDDVDVSLVLERFA